MGNVAFILAKSHSHRNIKLIPVMSNKKNLVIVRAGDNSLHESWLDSTRNWDILVSYFGDDPEKWRRDDAMLIFHRGGKFDGLYDAFQQMPHLLDQYEYIMMADDDFEMTPQDINRLFDTMRQYDLQIGHPSFSHRSYGTYFPAYHNPRFKIRFTNFVENGVACLHRAVWQQILPLYQDNPMAYHIDNFWAQLTDEPARQVALIDDIQVTHTRPYGTGELYQKMQQRGWDYEGPIKFMVPDHKPNWNQWRLTKIVCHKAINANGQTISGRDKVLPLLASGWHEIEKNITQEKMLDNRSVQESIAISIEDQKTGRSKLSKTKILLENELREGNISKMKNSRRKNLVIVRAGDNSLHESWLKNTPCGARNWDLLISYFGGDHERRQNFYHDDSLFVLYKGGKFDGLYEAFQQIPGLLDQYDYIMMADDDYIMTTQDINRTFDIMREHNLQAAQPSLSHQSCNLYFPAYHNPRFKIRFTNFLEAITVCLSANVWRQILPLYENNPMAFFIDNFWARLTDDPARQVALIDEVQVTHTRPHASGGLHHNMAERGWQKEGLVKYIVPDHRRDWDKWWLPKIVCHAGILANGRRVRGRWLTLPFLLSGWIKSAQTIDRANIFNHRSLHKSIRRSLGNQIMGIYKPTKTHIVICNPTQKPPQKLAPQKKSLTQESLVKKNLVIVRAGDNSLHESWLNNTPHSARNWDIIVSCYGDNPEKWQREDITHIVYKGGKGDGIYDTFQQVPNLLNQYEYIMMADDDFFMTAQDINRIFEIMRKYDLQVGQPSLSTHSYMAYFTAAHNSYFKIRFTNFLETNIVCLHTKIWKQILPLYQDNPMGWHIDFFWARLADNPARQVALIDEVQVTHMNPYEVGLLYQKIRQFGWTSRGSIQYSVPDHIEDMDQKWWKMKVVCHAGIRSNGRQVQGRWTMLAFLILGWLHAAKNIHRSQMIKNRSMHKCIRRSIENQITGIGSLAKTCLIIHGRDKDRDKKKPAQAAMENIR